MGKNKKNKIKQKNNIKEQKLDQKTKKWYQESSFKVKIIVTLIGVIVAGIFTLFAAIIPSIISSRKLSEDLKNKIDISGKWKYESPKDVKIWIINQNGSNINIVEEGTPKKGKGQYFHHKGVFTFSLDVPMTNGSKTLLEGKGKIDNSGNQIKGSIKRYGISNDFILDRIH